MSKVDYFNHLDKASDIYEKALTKTQEKKIQQIYDKSFQNAYKDLLANRSLWDFKATEAAKTAYVKQLYDQLYELSNKTGKGVTKKSTNMFNDFMSTQYEDYKDSELFKQVNKNVNVLNSWALDIIQKGKIYKDGVGLNSRLWHDVNSSGTKLDDAIQSCIAQGMGAADMARVIKDFGTGGHRTWDRAKIREKLGDGYARKYGTGGLDYEALRLARTTNTHLAQLKAKNEHKVNPYSQAVKYVSSHSAGRTCQQCIDRESADNYGLGAGVYPNEDCPYDHPNGLCHLTHVYIIDGKVVTPIEMAEDIGKWVKGDDNSGTMDKLYGNIPVTQRPKKEKNTAEEAAMKKRNAEINDYQQYFINKSNKQHEVQYFKDIDNTFKKFPTNIQDAYLEMYRGIHNFEVHGGQAYWQGSTRTLVMSVKEELKLAKQYNKGNYEVWFHESGHAMDSILGNATRGKVLSAQQQFIDALKSDFENSKEMVRRMYIKDLGRTIEPGKTGADYIRDGDLEKLYKKYLKGDDKTAGIQDVIEGISNCRIKIGWGHGKTYWNRRNREEEYASEAWANILGSYSDEGTYNYMTQYFPQAMKVQQDLIDKAMNKLKQNNIKIN